MSTTIQIDVARLTSSGFFKTPSAYTWTAHAGSQLFFLTRARESHISIEQAGSSRQAQCVRLDWTPCAFGGVRPWFRCPRTACGKRVRILRLLAESTDWCCGGCSGKTYPCRQKHRNRYFETLTRPARVLTDVERALGAAKTPAARQRVIRRALVADQDLKESLGLWSDRLSVERLLGSAV